MSIECNNTTPLASKASALTAPIGGAIDFSALIAQPDPLEQVDRVTIVDITDRLNNSLSTMNLSGYPTLRDRLEQFPLTYTEIADYVLNNNVDTSAILTELQGYSVAMIELPVTIAETLDDLDFYYETNLGKTISEGLCGTFGNILTELFAAFTLIDSTVAKLNALNLNDLDPKKLAISLAEKLKLEAIKEKLLETIDKLVKKIKKKIKKAVKKALDDIKTFVGNPGKAIHNQLTKIKKEIEDFFSEENMERIKNDVESFISEMISNFERPTLANIQLIMHQLCNFTEIIQKILFGPADELAELAKVVDKERKVLDATDANEQKKAEAAGAVRVEKEVAEELKEEATDSINANANDNNPNRYTVRVGVKNKRGQISTYRNEVRYRQPGELGYIDPSTGQLSIPTNVDYITSNVIKQDEIDAINSMNEDGIGPNDMITFSSRVRDKKEWEDVSNSVWSKLLRLSTLTGEKYVLRQGCVKSNSRGSAKTKIDVRKQGSDAYHHKYSGFAVEIEVNDSIREKTMIAASRVGFTGISVGRTYIKLNLGSRDGSVATKENVMFVESERFSDSEAAQIEPFMRTHRQDGYRKKRKSDNDFRFFDKSTFKQEEQNDGTFSFVDNNSILGISNDSDEDTSFSLLRPTD
jgi:hypothetical protein